MKNIVVLKYMAVEEIQLTPTRTHSISGLSIPEITIFGLK